MRPKNPRYHLYMKRRLDKLERQRSRPRTSCNSRPTLFRATKGGSRISQRYDVKIPSSFSIKDNPDETIRFFNKTIDTIMRGTESRKMFFDFEFVEYMTIDALMYLIAIVINIRISLCRVREFSGNTPRHPVVRKLFNSSGFIDIVTKRRSFIEANDAKHIVLSDKGEPQKTQDICEHIISESSLQRRNLLFLGEMLGELEGNVVEHAYNESTYERFHRKWFVYLDDAGEGLFKFTFLDTGVGIWNTMQKRSGDRLRSLFGNQVDAIADALNGGERTRTLRPYRGKGLPSIKEHAVSGRVVNLSLITNKAYCYYDENEIDQLGKKTITSPLHGTIFYWEISEKEFDKDNDLLFHSKGLYKDTWFTVQEPKQVLRSGIQRRETGGDVPKG